MDLTCLAFQFSPLSTMMVLEAILYDFFCRFYVVKLIGSNVFKSQLITTYRYTIYEVGRVASNSYMIIWTSQNCCLLLPGQIGVQS